MDIQEFIDNNYDELLQHIKSVCPNCQIFNDKDIEQWILNDEGLYLWAKGEGVKV